MTADIPLFSYGTLQRRDVQLATYRRPLDGSPDALVGYRLEVIPDRDPDAVPTAVPRRRLREELLRAVGADPADRAPVAASGGKEAYRDLRIAYRQWITDLADFYGLNLLLAETSATSGGLDSLLAPVRTLKKAQDLAARAFGAKHTFFVTNGTSTANASTFTVADGRELIAGSSGTGAPGDGAGVRSK